MTENDDAARRRLEALKAEILALSLSSGDDRKPVELDQQSVGRLSRMDSLQVQAMAKAADARRAGELKRIEAALIRVEDGDYGACVRCGEAIAVKRLGVDPATPFCADCAT